MLFYKYCWFLILQTFYGRRLLILNFACKKSAELRISRLLIATDLSFIRLLKLK